MDTLIKAIKDLPASKWMMVVGTIGMIISAISTGIMGYQVADEMKFAVFGVCAIMAVVGYGGWLYTKKLDVEIRIEKMEQGGKEAADKDETIIQ